MKKSIFSILASVLFLSTFGLISDSYSQNLNGRIFATGTLSFFSEDEVMRSGAISASGPERTRFNFSPGAGYFINDDLAIGALITFDYFKDEIQDGNDIDRDTDQVIMFEPFARYMITSLGDLHFYGQGSVAFGSGSVKNEYISGSTVQTNERDLSAFAVNAAVGTTYFLSDSFGLEIRFGVLQYRTDTVSYTEGNNRIEINNSSTGFSIDLTNLLLGLSYYF